MLDLDYPADSLTGGDGDRVAGLLLHLPAHHLRHWAALLRLHLAALFFRNQLADILSLALRLCYFSADFLAGAFLDILHCASWTASSQVDNFYYFLLAFH